MLTIARFSVFFFLFEKSKKKKIASLKPLPYHHALNTKETKNEIRALTKGTRVDTKKQTTKKIQVQKKQAIFLSWPLNASNMQGNRSEQPSFIVHSFYIILINCWSSVVASVVLPQFCAISTFFFFFHNPSFEAYAAVVTRAAITFLLCCTRSK